MPCPVCRLNASSGLSLSNGEILHSDCLRLLKTSVSEAGCQLAASLHQLNDLRVQQSRLETYLSKIARFFGRGDDPEILMAHIATVETRRTSEEQALRNAVEKATPIYDIMLDYPPDWAQRSAAVRQEFGCCTNCFSEKKLETHHVQPLSQGGTNRIDNLTLLCERCHRKEHGGRQLGNRKTSSSLAISEKVSFLNKAIESGADVEFMYRKPSESSENRRVRAIALVGIARVHTDGSTLCLRGYCHLRRSERNFALTRMTQLKISKV